MTIPTTTPNGLSVPMHRWRSADEVERTANRTSERCLRTLLAIEETYLKYQTLCACAIAHAILATAYEARFGEIPRTGPRIQSTGTVKILDEIVVFVDGTTENRQDYERRMA